MKKYRPVLFGIAGAAGLLFVYFGILTLVESASSALFQFSDIWYWILILAAGFGLQLGLHVHIKAALRARQAAGTAGVAASGGVSTVAMVACCAHHIADVLPILGLSAAAVFLVEFQTAFILLGVFSNLVGVTMMLRIMQKHGLEPKTGPFRALFAFNMKQVLAAVVVSAILGTGISFVVAGTGMAEQVAETPAAKTFDLDSQEKAARGVSVEVEPIDFSLGMPVGFEISLNTHSGALDTDLAATAVLVDDKGTAYQPTGWDGSPPGGHHRSGTLFFPALGAETQSIKLTLKGINGVPERVFEWPLL
jgi:hypothetical protein